MIQKLAWIQKLVKNDGLLSVLPVEWRQKLILMGMGLIVVWSRTVLPNRIFDLGPRTRF